MPGSKESTTITELLQSLFFTKTGREFINYRSVAATQLLKNAEANGESYFLKPLSHFPGGHNLIVIASDQLTKESLEYLSSGYYPKSRDPFSPFARMLDMQKGKGVQAWVFEQSHAAKNSRQLLAKHMLNGKLSDVELESLEEELRARLERECETPYHKFDLLRARVQVKLEKEFEKIKENPEPCLYQWTHQIVMELLCEHVLGINKVPKSTHTILDQTEFTIVNESQPFSLFGQDVPITSSQQKYKKQKGQWKKFSKQLIRDNFEQIQRGPGYLHEILCHLAQERDCGIDELTLNDDVLDTLAAGVGLLFAGGTLSTTLTTALMHLNENLLEELETIPAQDDDTFIANFFKESLRYTASAAHNYRFSGKPLNIELQSGEKVTIPKDTFIVIDHRRSFNRESKFSDPGKFDVHRFSTFTPSHDTAFTPFSLGPRGCPGQKIARIIFPEYIRKFKQHHFYIQPCDESDLDIQCGKNTTEDFVTRPQRNETFPFDLIEAKTGEIIMSSTDIGFYPLAEGSQESVAEYGGIYGFFDGLRKSTMDYIETFNPNYDLGC